MALQFFKDAPTNDNVPVSSENPLPVRQIELPGYYQLPVAGQTITRLYQVPGIATADAFDSGDAFGTPIKLADLFRPEKGSGLIMGMFLLDLDDEGIQIDVPLFVGPIVGVASDAAASFTDGELMLCRWVFSINTFYNWATNQFGQTNQNPMHIVAGGPDLWTQLIVIGTPTIAALNVPVLGITVVPD